MKHSIHLAAIALLTTLLVTSCDTFSAPADPDKNTEQVKDISGTWQLTTVSRNSNDITETMDFSQFQIDLKKDCLLYTSPSPRDAHESRMPSSA